VLSAYRYEEPDEFWKVTELPNAEVPPTWKLSSTFSELAVPVVAVSTAKSSMK